MKAGQPIPPRQTILGYREQEVESNSRPYPQQIQTAGIPMTEERKFAILFAATLLVARRLIDLDRSGQTEYGEGILRGQSNR